MTFFHLHINSTAATYEWKKKRTSKERKISAKGCLKHSHYSFYILLMKLKTNPTTPTTNLKRSLLAKK